MEKEKEFKNWEYIVLIIMLCVIITLLSIVLYKAINKKKEKNINEDNIVSNTKIDEKLYKTFNRKDYDTLKNIKDNYVVRDMKIVQSDNSFTSIKLNDNEVGIRYVIYQEENELLKVPSRNRIKYNTRDKVKDFVKNYIIANGSTKKKDLINLD